MNNNFKYSKLEKCASRLLTPSIVQNVGAQICIYVIIRINQMHENFEPHYS